jgi:hypothetical protein
MNNFDSHGSDLFQSLRIALKRALSLYNRERDPSQEGSDGPAPERNVSASSADDLIRLKSIAFKALPIYPVPFTLYPVLPARVELCIDNAGDIHYR